MRIEKEVLDHIPKVYAPCISEHEGDPVYIGCSEGKGPAVAVTRDGKEHIWEEPGGTMNIVRFPGTADMYFATRSFLPVFDAQGCTLDLVTFRDGRWTVRPIMGFPYLHRFDLFTRRGKVYFFGATLCGGKSCVQDWSRPGSVYVAEVSPEMPDKPLKLKEICHGITRNHGMWHEKDWGKNGAVFVTGTEGVFVCEIPDDPIRDRWQVERLLPQEVSDIALCDIDGDGQIEIATIEGFHGDRARIYHLNTDGYVPVMQYDIAFGHVLWGGQIAGKPAFLLGWRDGEKALKALTVRDGIWNAQPVDTGCGPSQIAVRQSNGSTLILAANRQAEELALYRITS